MEGDKKVISYLINDSSRNTGDLMSIFVFPNPYVGQRLIIWSILLILLLGSYLLTKNHIRWLQFKIISTVPLSIFTLIILPITGLIDHYWACGRWFDGEAMVHHEPIIVGVALIGVGIIIGSIITKKNNTKIS